MRLLDARLRHLDPLETAGEGAVLLEVAPVVVVGRRPDAADLTPGERGLQDVRGVERAALHGSGSHHGVDLVDEEDCARLRAERPDHGLETRLELAPELGAGEEGPHVERVDADLAQRRRHLATMDAEREALDDGGLPHPGVTHEDGVVLPAAAEDVDRPLELPAAADERVDVARGRALDQVDGEGGEGVAGRPRPLLVVLLFGLGRRLGRLGDAVREVGDHVESGDALVGEEVGRVGVRLAEDRDQHVSPVELLLAGRLHVGGGPLEDALEAEGPLR